MNSKPIPFSGPMVRAILEGRKTQTRRIIKPQPVVNDGWVEWRDGQVSLECTGWIADMCPYGFVDDLLWVREKMRVIDINDYGTQILAIRVRYEADGTESDWITWPERLKGNPIVGKCLAYGGFREASRLTLELQNVRVERVQDISSDDCIAEGVGKPIGTSLHYGSVTEAWNIDRCFAPLWCSLNAKRGFGWEVNPLVWVLEFKAYRHNVDEFLETAA